MINSWQLYAQLPPFNPNYSMVFCDNFDSLHINTNNWNKNFNWGNVDYALVDTNGDNITEKVFLKCYTPDSEYNFNFDTSGTGKISLRTKHETTPYSGLVWDYNYLDTIYIDHNILYSGLNSSSHSVGTFSFYLDSTTYLMIVQDSIYTIDSLHVTRDSIHRMFRAYNKNFNYTTSMLRSRNQYRFGYFDIKFHLPYLDNNHNNQGVGPNYWLYEANDTIPWSEIDIFEIKDDSLFSGVGQYKHMHTAATHITPDTLTTTTLQSDYKYFNQLNFCDTCYRNFSVFWDDKNIKYYTDNNYLWESNNYPNRMIEMPLIIGNSVPINGFGNTYMPDLISPMLTILPYYYSIDYIKVYQLKQHCDSNVVITTFNPDNFGYGLYKTISLGGSGSSSTIQSGKKVPLMATDAVTINGTFTVDLGAEFSIETRPCLPQTMSHKSLQQGTQIPPPDSFYKTFFAY
jgi:hypothetical protein